MNGKANAGHLDVPENIVDQQRQGHDLCRSAGYVSTIEQIILQVVMVTKDWLL